MPQDGKGSSNTCRERLQVYLREADIQHLDEFSKLAGFTSRTEAIRACISEALQARRNAVLEKETQESLMKALDIIVTLSKKIP